MVLYYRFYNETSVVSITTDNKPVRDTKTQEFQEADYMKKDEAMKNIMGILDLDSKSSPEQLSEYLINWYIKMINDNLSELDCNIELCHYLYIIDSILPLKNIEEYNKYINYKNDMQRNLCDIVLNKCKKFSGYQIERVYTYRKFIGGDKYAFEALYHYMK